MEGETAQALDCKIETLCQELEKLPRCGQTPGYSQKLDIDCGFALDCLGNELVLARPAQVDIWQCLSSDDRDKALAHCEQGITLFVSLCHKEIPVDPIRPAVPDTCGAVASCVAGKTWESVCVSISSHPPAHGLHCEACCETCQDPCLLIARIEGYRPGHPLACEQVDNSVRRRIHTPYDYTTITSINWKHGAHYAEDDISKLLGDGLEVRFSRPVLVSTLIEGIVDLWVVQGGGGRHADIYNVDLSLDGGSEHCTRTLRICPKTDDCPDPGDRFILIIRAAFILDECCQPVDGAHVGGRVPHRNSPHGDGEHHRHEHHAPGHPCPMPPPGYGPWTSGTSHPGANFESWFYVAERSRNPHSKTDKD